ncbi:MAG: glutathione binding-like protein [Pseudomonadota bacterium]
MIDLYYWTTPNGHKITLFLEEAGLEYNIKPVNIGRGEQFQPDFLKISPNNRIPAIVDYDPIDGGKPISVFESGAILIYLAGKTGKLMPKDLRGQVEVMEWLMWQISALGPMAGQFAHFAHYAPEHLSYPTDRYLRETGRLYAVLDKQLTERVFIAGEYSIVDIACYPWITPERQDQNLDEFPNLQRWKETIESRPATKRAYARADEVNPEAQSVVEGEESWNILFGQGKETVQRTLM